MCHYYLPQSHNFVWNAKKPRESPSPSPFKALLFTNTSPSQELSLSHDCLAEEGGLFFRSTPPSSLSPSPSSSQVLLHLKTFLISDLHHLRSKPSSSLPVYLKTFIFVITCSLELTDLEVVVQWAFKSGDEGGSSSKLIDLEDDVHHFCLIS